MMKTGYLLPREAHESLDNEQPQKFEHPSKAYPKEFVDVPMTERMQFWILCSVTAGTEYVRLSRRHLRSGLEGVAKSVETFIVEAEERLLGIKEPCKINSLFDLVAIFRTCVSSLIEHEFRWLNGTQRHEVLRDKDGNVIYHSERVNEPLRGKRVADPNADLSLRPMTQYVRHVSSFVERQYTDGETGALDGSSEIFRPLVGSESSTWIFESPVIASHGVQRIIAAMERLDLTKSQKLLLRIFKFIDRNPDLLLVDDTGKKWTFNRKLLAARLEVKITDIDNALRPVSRGENKLAPKLGWNTMSNLAEDIAPELTPDRHPLSDKYSK